MYRYSILLSSRWPLGLCQYKRRAYWVELVETIETHPSVYVEPLISYLAEVVYHLILLQQLMTSDVSLKKRLQPSKRPLLAQLPHSSHLLIVQVGLPCFLVFYPICAAEHNIFVLDWISPPMFTFSAEFHQDQSSVPSCLCCTRQIWCAWFSNMVYTVTRISVSLRHIAFRRHFRHRPVTLKGHPASTSRKFILTITFDPLLGLTSG